VDNGHDVATVVNAESTMEQMAGILLQPLCDEDGVRYIYICIYVYMCVCKDITVRRIAERT
jgi:hypothetical protein